LRDWHFEAFGRRTVPGGLGGKAHDEIGARRSYQIEEQDAEKRASPEIQIECLPVESPALQGQHRCEERD